MTTIKKLALLVEYLPCRKEATQQKDQTFCHLGTCHPNSNCYISHYSTNLEPIELCIRYIHFIGNRSTGKITTRYHHHLSLC